MDFDKDKSFLERVEKMVDQIEKSTSVDIVVTIAPRSASYTDVEIATGSVLAWLVLIFILHSPFSFDPLSIPVDLLLAFLIGWQATQRLHPLLRLLTSPARRRRQVDVAAAAAVHDTGVTETRDRTGLLIHLSSLEQDAAIIPDVGLQHQVPRGTFDKLRDDLEAAMRTSHPEEAILKALSTAQEVLSTVCPATEANPHHIPSRPRVIP